MIVNEHEARLLRSAIIQYLEKSEEQFLSFGSWEDIIDPSLYDNYHALRMNGSNKYATCPKCKNKKKIKYECMTCNTLGRIDVGRVYKPYLIINPDNTYNNELLLELQNDYYKNLKYTSIRSDNYESTIVLNNPPSWFSNNKYNLHNSRRSSKKKVPSKSVKKNPLKNAKNQEEISERDEKYIQLKKYLESELFRLSKYYSDIDLDRLKKIFHNRSFYYVFTCKSHYCMNMKREHSSNHIYFIINKKSKDVYQKCQSPWKNIDGICCEDFKSRSLSLPDELYKILFVDKSDSEKSTPRKKLKTTKKSIIDKKSLLNLSLDD